MYFRRINGIYQSPTCDDCAEGGHVYFHTLSDGTKVQSRPWCWSNFESGVCDVCCRDVSFARNVEKFADETAIKVLEDAGLTIGNWTSDCDGNLNVKSAEIHRVREYLSRPRMTIHYVKWSKCLSITKVV